MDEAYFNEFHRQWVAAVGTGWRRSKRIAVAFFSISLLAALTAWSQELPALELLALGFFVFGVTVTVSLVRRRAAWLKSCRALPWYEKTLRIEVRDGDLVQVKDYAVHPAFQRTGALVVTPDGYLVRYRGAVESTSKAVSTTDASVYIPHSKIKPSMTREAFLGSLQLNIQPTDESNARA